MGKRTLEDTGLANADPNITDVKKSKKSKKEKRPRTEDPIGANGLESGVENIENLPQKDYTLIYGLDEGVQEKLKQAKNAVAKALAEDPPLKVQKDKKAKAEEEGKKSEKKKRTEGKALTAEDVALKAQRKAEKKARGEDGPPKEESTPVVEDDGVVDEEEKLKKAQRKADKKARKAADREERSKGKKAKKDATKKETIAEPANSEPITNGTSAEKENKESEPPVSKPITNGASEIYTEDPNLTALPQAEIDKFLADNFITITDPRSTTFRPITKFTYLPVTNSSQLTPFKDFKAPTSIQAAAWPFLLAGRDVIGVAETGSGKTMAFAVPCVRSISALPKNQRNKGARAVVVSPTRELAMQSFEQITKLAKVHGLQTVCVYGGVPKHQQREDLKTADIVIATPGRLNDLINEGFADLSKAKYVVLDEADRMLDKGFEEEIRKIINTTPAISERQTLMFTATWPESVRTLASTFMRTPVKITIGDNPTGDLRANTRIVQKVEVVDPRSKEFRLMQLLKTHSAGAKKNDRILVFCLYKKEATRVEQFIRGKGFNVGGIHGDLSQEQRTRSLEAFKKGNTPVLVATDVAARGLDIPDVQLVINCTFPLTVEDYVHRIGRTGRAGKDGLAITLFTEHDKAQSGALINVLKAANQEVPEELMKFGTTVKKKGHEAYGAFFKDVDSTKTATKITFD